MCVWLRGWVDVKLKVNRPKKLRSAVNSSPSKSFHYGGLTRDVTGEWLQPESFTAVGYIADRFLKLKVSFGRFPHSISCSLWCPEMFIILFILYFGLRTVFPAVCWASLSSYSSNSSLSFCNLYPALIPFTLWSIPSRNPSLAWIFRLLVSASSNSERPITSSASIKLTLAEESLSKFFSQFSEIEFFLGASK